MFCRQDPNSRMQLNQWWSHQIHDTPSRDSADPLLHGLRPGLQTELNFWKARKDNLLLKKKQVRHLRYYCKHQGELSFGLPFSMHFKK